ncbi:family 9 glycoside hydrolase [Powellomyces hirtus]|nr:family 9 glycoside hydrolase [Powellomyces hirtus]
MITPPGPVVNSAAYVAPATTKYDYADALHKSFLFYWAQRSGKLPYQRLAWRGDSFVGTKGKYGEDLSGGWFEAANTMKWGGPFGFTAAQLAWNVVEFGPAMKAVNEYNEGINWVRIGAEYLLNTYTNDGTTERLMGLFGDSAVRGPTGGAIDVDFGYFGPPEEYLAGVPFGQPPNAYYCEGSATVNRGCSDIAGDYAAALAAASVALRPIDPVFADRCVAMAKNIYNFGNKYKGTYDTVANFPDQAWNNYREWYKSYGVNDEIAYASAWLHIATKEEIYYTNAQAALALVDGFSEYSWADKAIAAAILLNKAKPDAATQATIKTFFASWLPGGSRKRTPRGLVYGEKWGSLRYAANIAYIALAHAKSLAATASDAPLMTQLQTFAVQQINYMLGDCGRSWVVGFGENYPKSPYHKSSYNSYIDYPLRGQSQGVVGDDFLNSATPNRFILYGALVGGPEDTDEYVDNRKDYVYTEVTQDYNAAFTGALAGLVDFYGPTNFKPASDCGLDLGWTHPNATQAAKPVYKAGDCYHTCDACTANATTTPGSSPTAGGDATSAGAAGTPDAAAGAPADAQNSAPGSAVVNNLGVLIPLAIGGLAAAVI